MMLLKAILIDNFLHFENYFYIFHPIWILWLSLSMDINFCRFNENHFFKDTTVCVNNKRTIKNLDFNKKTFNGSNQQSTKISIQQILNTVIYVKWKVL